MGDICLDHIVIFVPNLRDAISNFSALGFNVVLGGEHEATENALIVFDDQTYLELLALKRTRLRKYIRLAALTGILKLIARRKMDLQWRLLPWVTYKFGSIDWCIRVKDVEKTLKHWESNELTNLGSQEFSRERPDGRTAKWILGSLKNVDLPFLLSDVSKIDVRIPVPTAPHPNGVTGISKIWIATRNITQATRRFDACFLKGKSNSNCSLSYLADGKRLELVDASHHKGKIALQLKGSREEETILDPRKTFGMRIMISSRDG
ncbi:VOC family protein [Hellea balneolensis]|uniref:VOC family protein n=1 Tax=Hellea balneolensis TaxID=287478 RepID=UPI00040EED95|nr:VOC family protein [Hellea balneolensis]